MVFGAAKSLILGAAVLLFGVQFSGTAQAQGAFCPPGFVFLNGTCTNGKTGAFSGAALASESLNDLSQSAVHESSGAAQNAISRRRTAEAERCPAGFVRQNGVCERAPSAEPRQIQAAPSGKKRVAQKRRAPPVVVAQPVAQPYPVDDGYSGIRFASWAQGFGDFERRDGKSTFTADATNGVGLNVTTPISITSDSRARTGGFTGGLDATSRWGDGSGVIVGALTGYTSSNVTIKSSQLSTNLANIANGFSNVKVNISGPSAGAFAAYFSRTLSADVMFKANFFDFNETFNDVLGFSANGPLGIAAVSVPFVGAGSTNLTTYTTAGNLNYRLWASQTLWFEPTVGVEYTSSQYGSQAFLLGLADGHVLKVQAGARIGFEQFVGQARFTTVLTGLVYDDVEVRGGFIQNTATGANLLTLNDEGKVRGQGILSFNVDAGNGWSYFIQGDVRGGDGLFGYGGKGGIRVVW